jgi:hypothetical protein
MKEWVREWLENERHKGKTCLEVKMVGLNYFVYHSTNRYDKEQINYRHRLTLVGSAHIPASPERA